MERVGMAEETRASGRVPAVLYGPEMDAKSVSVDYRTFEKLFSEAGESNLVDFTIGGSNSSKVLIQEVQVDPVRGSILHVDFRQINMSKEMTATIDINLVGEAPAVKTLGGTLFHGLDTLNIKCLPKDLVGFVEVDISILASFDDIISIGDIKLPEGIVTTDHLDTTVVKVTAPLTDAELAAMEETKVAAVETVEVAEKRKKDDGEAVADGVGGDKKAAPEAGKKA